MPRPVKLPRPGEAKENPVPQDNQRIIDYVTFFGDSAIPEDHPEYKKVYSLAQALAKQGFGIVNGGGPGVMKAATDGAESVDGHTIAVYWEPKLASHFEGKNNANVADETEAYSNYMMRTLGLIEKGQAYICCIGGTGTISEFGMVWGLAKMYFGKHKPVILFGDFWEEIVDSFHQNMLIDDQEMGVLYYANSNEQVIELLNQFEREMRDRVEESIEGDESAFVVDPRKYLTRQSYAKSAQQYHTEREQIKLVSQAQLDEFMTLVPDGRILDLGCGPGYDLKYLSQKYQQLDGVDVNYDFCKIAQQQNPEATIICGDIMHINLEQNAYSGIWARDSFHHVPESEQDQLFAKAAGSLEPNGVLYVIAQQGEGEEVTQEIRSGHTLTRFYHYYDKAELESRGDKAGLDMVKFGEVTRSHQWLIAVYRKRA